MGNNTKETPAGVKQKNKYHISILFLLLAICVVVSSTLAWYSKNMKGDADINDMQIKANGLRIDGYNVYHYDYEENKVINIINDDDQYLMTPYDSIFDERNSNTLLIFEVFLYHFTESGSSVNVYVDREHTDYAYADPDNHFTSNIIFSKAASAGTIGIDPINDSLTEEEIFSAAREYFADNGEKKQFINVEKDAGVGNYSLKSTSDRMTLDASLTADEQAAIAGAGGEEVRIPVYFVIDYDNLLIRAQKLENFSDIEIIDNLAVDYKNDIISILFEENI